MSFGSLIGESLRRTQSSTLNLERSSKNPPDVMASDDDVDDNFVLDYFWDSAESRDALQLCLRPCEYDLLSSHSGRDS